MFVSDVSPTFNSSAKSNRLFLSQRRKFWLPFPEKKAREELEYLAKKYYYFTGL